MEYVKISEMPVSASDLFRWHEQDGALPRLVPPWENVRVVHKDPGLKPGTEVHLQMKKGPVKLLWVARHVAYALGEEFSDEQVKGPFAKWHHRHRMIPVNETRSKLEDRIEYKTPLGLGMGFAKSEIERMFRYRHEVMQHDLEVQQRYPSPPLKVAITGASGLIGSALRAFLQTAGHEVLPLVRGAPGPGEIYWNPHKGEIEAEKLEGCDLVVHLAGESIASGRWTAKRKDRLRSSRIKGTRLLVQALNKLENPPKTLISASAIGIYGVHPEGPVKEDSPQASDFLAQLCVDWESEAQQYSKGRVVIPRFGVVISPKGGALAKMLLPFSLGLGGEVGSGTQWMSWIALDDAIYALYHVAVEESVSGPINLVSPQPLTNAEFTKVLGKVLRRPTFFPLPAFVARSVFGEMAEATLLSSSQVEPAELKAQQHHFYFPEIEEALRYGLGRY